MRQAENRIVIEGILSEVDLNYSSFMKNGVNHDAIGGTIKVLVETPEATLEVPVYMFSTKLTTKGGVNPAYTSIENVKNTMVSIAASDKEHATKVRITNAEIRMNEFFGRDGNLVSTPRITASFVNFATGDFNPRATFSLEFFMNDYHRVVDSDGVELDPPKLEVNVIVPGYRDRVDVVKLHATNPNVINAIETYWEPGHSYKAAGNVNFTNTIETVVEQMGFGQPQTRTRTITLNEFIITGGSEEPLATELEFAEEDIMAGIADRKVRLEQLKNNARTTKQTPSPEMSEVAKKGLDLGF